MSDVTGDVPAFEQPDFSKFGGAADAAELEVEDAEALGNEALDSGDADEPDESFADNAGNTAPERERAAGVLEHIATSIVDDKEAVVVDVRQNRGQLRLSLHVAPSDMGRIIGRRGRTAQAVRTLVRAAAAADGQDAFVDIVD